MTRVVIGMDPHKRSVTIEVMKPDETVLDGGRHATDGAGRTTGPLRPGRSVSALRWCWPYPLSHLTWVR